MTEQRMSYCGSRYIRTSSGRWYLLFERAACLCINRHGTQYWRAGTQVWKDVSLSTRATLENEFISRTRKDFRESKSAYNRWGKVIRTLILGAGTNEHLHDLASILESLRQTHIGRKQQQLRTTLDEIAIQSRTTL
ncbi:hypothetical protein pEaSNUABM13_00278 [Erwinia phage pEa_SNUABM_13]|nr:hypothetical protein pEaSNUABM13_00278 [Erwinia phage pEa_SNUABM_13]